MVIIMIIIIVIIIIIDKCRLGRTSADCADIRSVS